MGTRGTMSKRKQQYFGTVIACTIELINDFPSLIYIPFAIHYLILKSRSIQFAKDMSEIYKSLFILGENDYFHCFTWIKNALQISPQRNEFASIEGNE